MSVLHVDKLSISYGLKPLLDQVSFTLDKGERVCLIGRNGEGKSTLLKIIAGMTTPTEGQVRLPPEYRLGYLHQEVDIDSEQTVYDEVIGGLGEIAGLLREYHVLTAALSRGEDRLHDLERIQSRLEAQGGWQINHRIESVLQKMGLDPDQRWKALSGGRRRRVCLARALVAEPDLLILDEPTNHLDIESIRWLETVLLDYPGALLFVTHDRQLLRRLATRILELDRGALTSWPGDYSNYLRRREERDHAESLAQRRFDKKLSQEEVWIRQGIQARRTRNEGRVRALLDLRRKYQERRGKQGQARLEMDAGEQSGKKVIAVENLTYRWSETAAPIVEGLNFTLMRGDRVALIGANGCGKTTLIKLLLGELAPTAGLVTAGTRLEIAYYDQMRARLDESRSILDNVAGGSDYVEVNGKRRHIISWLGDFLFSPERLRTPVAALSGGERNRLMLARLFAQPANLLIMDEPTNDLDIETLELLEELLNQFTGTLLLVSHDRDFIDNTVTSSLVFRGNGRVLDLVGGYSDAAAQLAALASPSPGGRDRSAAARAPESATPAPSAGAPPAAVTEVAGVAEQGRATPRPATVFAAKGEVARKLSFKERRELEALPDQIAALEVSIELLRAETTDSAFYQRQHTEVKRVLGELADCESRMDSLFARWEALDTLK